MLNYHCWKISEHSCSLRVVKSHEKVAKVVNGNSWLWSILKDWGNGCNLIWYNQSNRPLNYTFEE